MSENTSKRILKIELLFIVPPSAMLLLGATISHIGNMREYSLWGDKIILLLAFASWASLMSGLIILNSFIKQGRIGLRNLKPYLWLMSSFGALILIAAWISKLQPPSPVYSDEAIFRFYFEAFTYGSALLIPYFHLAIELFFAKMQAQNNKAIADKHTNYPQ